jgi:hypothetical protein
LTDDRYWHASLRRASCRHGVSFVADQSRISSMAPTLAPRSNTSRLARFQAFVNGTLGTKRTFQSRPECPLLGVKQTSLHTVIASDNSCYRRQFFRGVTKTRALIRDDKKLRAQIKYIRSGRTSLLFAVRGKCCASLFPHTLIAVIKPSAIRPSRMCATSASTAACHSDWGT